jgi:hypothetical protein
MLCGAACGVLTQVSSGTHTQEIIVLLMYQCAMEGTSVCHTAIACKVHEGMSQHLTLCMLDTRSYSSSAAAFTAVRSFACSTVRWGWRCANARRLSV